MRDNIIQTEEQIEGYIVDGIVKYKLSNEQLIRNLIDLGLDGDSAKKWIVETRKKHNLFSKRHILDEEVNIFTDVIVMVFACLIAINVWSFIRLLHVEATMGSNMVFPRVNVFLGGALIVLSVFTAIRMFLCKCDVIILSCIYLILASGSSIASLVLGDGDPNRSLVVLVWCVLFGLYIWAAPTFRKNFPKSRFYWFDIALLVGIIMAVLSALFRKPETPIEKDEYPVMNQEDYKNDLANYVDRLNERIPYFDERIGSVDKVEYSTMTNIVKVYVSDTISDKRILNIMDRMSEYYSESSLVYSIKQSLPDSLNYYLYGTGASVSYNLAHGNGKVYVSKSLSYKEWMDTITNEQFENYCRDYVHFSVDMVNAYCPGIIDEYTTLASVHYDAEKLKVNIRYDLSYSKKSITEALVDEMYRNLKLELHYKKSTYIFYTIGGISVQYDYYDKNGDFVTSFMFTPEQLKNL